MEQSEIIHQMTTNSYHYHVWNGSGDFQKNQSFRELLLLMYGPRWYVFAPTARSRACKTSRERMSPRARGVND
jgi:hypothetical protein